MTEMERAAGLKAVAVAKGLLHWSEEFSQTVWSGVDGIFTATIMKDDGKYPLFKVGTDGRFGFRLRRLCMKPVFSDREVQIEMLRRVNEIPGVNLTEETLGSKAGFELALLNDPLALQKFKAVVEWLADQIKKSSPTKESLNGTYA
jgi:hypothetical protein